MRGEARLTETNTQEMLREIRIALLEADVALPVVRDFIAQVKEKALGQEVLQSLSPGQALVGIVHNALIDLIGGETAELDLASKPPAIILMAGLQGAGKTTTVGKIGKWLTKTAGRRCWWCRATCTARPPSSSCAPWPARPAWTSSRRSPTRSPPTSPARRWNGRRTTITTS